MRQTEPAPQFKRDYKRKSSGSNKAMLDSALSEVVELLVHDQPLPERLLDRKFMGAERQGYRLCLIRHGLLLIYRKLGTDVLQLVRLASHNELKL